MPGSRQQSRSSGEKRKEAEVSGRVPSCSTCEGTEPRRGDVTGHCGRMRSAARELELPGTSSSSLVSLRGTVSLGMAESSKCPAPKLLFLFLPSTNKQSFPHLTPEKDSQASSPGSCVTLPCVRAARCCGLLDSPGDTHTDPCALGLGKHSAFTTQRSSVLLPPREARSLCFA